MFRKFALNQEVYPAGMVGGFLPPGWGPREASLSAVKEKSPLIYPIEPYIQTNTT